LTNLLKVALDYILLSSLING